MTYKFARGMSLLGIAILGVMMLSSIVMEILGIEANTTINAVLGSMWLVGSILYVAFSYKAYVIESSNDPYLH